MKKVKTLRGYTALAKFQATLKTKPSGDLYIAGFMPCHLMPVISAFCYAPAYSWNRLDNKNQDCVKAIETSHAVYEVWQLETRAEHDSIVSENEATEKYLKHLRDNPKHAPFDQRYKIDLNKESGN